MEGKFLQEGNEFPDGPGVSLGLHLEDGRMDQVRDRPAFFGGRAGLDAGFLRVGVDFGEHAGEDGIPPSERIAVSGNVEDIFVFPGVVADETRPVGQGARLTAWELARAGVPVTLICDDMAASLMAQGTVDAVLVGADRIARNGDTANKIGTYGLAVLAHEHGIPFYVAAPRSTIDFDLEDGSQIIIEQRSPEEVLQHPINGVDVWNPAFDVTPARYITGIVTEAGVFSPSDLASLDSAVL